MPVIDDIKESHSKVKGKGFKYKFKYYWEYYSKPAAIILFFVICIISLVKAIVTSKDIEFEAVFLNSSNIPSEEEFAEMINVDMNEYEVYFDNSYIFSANPNDYSETNYTNSQKLMAVIASAQADIMLGDSTVMSSYFNAQILADLRDYFSEDELNALGDKVIWHTLVDSETGLETGEPFPIAINVGDSSKLSSNECYFTEDVYCSIVVNTKHPDYAKTFYEYLYK